MYSKVRSSGLFEMGVIVKRLLHVVPTLFFSYTTAAWAQWNMPQVCERQYVQAKNIWGSYLVYAGRDLATYRVCGIGANRLDIFSVDADPTPYEFRNPPATRVDMQAKKITVQRPDKWWGNAFIK